MVRSQGDVAVEVIAGDGRLRDRLAEDLSRARRASIAVAFAKTSGLGALDLEQWCDGKRELRLLAGTDFYVTELAVLRRLESRPGAACRVFHSLDVRAFHPKVYVLERDDSVVAYVGSSNFTAGGLRDNVEANVRLEGPRSELPISTPLSFFDGLFSGEFATALSPEFERRYDELQKLRQSSDRWQREGDGADQFRVAERMLVGDYRGRHAVKRWLLVVTPENFDICMRTGTWGRQHEHEIAAYAPGDVFFFHVTGRGRIAALGMFTGQPYRDDDELWRDMGKGSFPWRIRLVPLGTLLNGIPTRSVLEPLRPGAPARWFNGFIQASHSLEPSDFEALRTAFEQALRLERRLASA